MVKSKYVEKPSATRIFDGKRYRRSHEHGYSTKFLAHSKAKREREKGYNARVVKFMDRYGDWVYYVYTRRRKK